MRTALLLCTAMIGAASAQPDAGAKPGTQSDSKQAKSDAKPGAEPGPKPTAKSDANPGAKPNPNPTAKSDAKPAATSDVKPIAKPAAKPAAKPNANAGAKPDASEPDANEPAAKAKILPDVRGQSEAQRGVELSPPATYERDATKAKAFGGGTALGMVVTPEWHNDMRPYSDGGMVIRPPETGDHNVIVPGTSGLPGRPLLNRWMNVLKYGADRFWERVIPSAGGT